MMIVNTDHPSLSIYRLGSELLNILTSSPLKEFDTLFLYDSFKDKTPNEISFGYFMLALDWLYLLDLIDLADNGDIKKCF